VKVIENKYENAYFAELLRAICLIAVLQRLCWSRVGL